MIPAKKESTTLEESYDIRTVKAQLAAALLSNLHPETITDKEEAHSIAQRIVIQVEAVCEALGL